MSITTGTPPAGLAFGLIISALSYWKALLSEDMTTNPLANPLVRVVVQRRMTSFFFLGLAVGASVNTAFFLAADVSRRARD